MLKSHYKHYKIQEFSIAVKLNVTAIRNTFTVIHRINFVNRTEVTFNIMQPMKKLQSKLSCYLIGIRFMFVNLKRFNSLSLHNIQLNFHRENAYNDIDNTRNYFRL